MSFTKLCDASYDQLTCSRSHKLILLTNCYIALGCVACALLCVAPHYTAHRKLRWYARTRRTNLTHEHLCERPPRCPLWLLGAIQAVQKDVWKAEIHMPCMSVVQNLSLQTTLTECRIFWTCQKDSNTTYIISVTSKFWHVCIFLHSLHCTQKSQIMHNLKNCASNCDQCLM